MPLAPIIGAIARFALPAISALGAGISTYQTLTGPGGAGSSGTALVPLTRSEQQRRALARVPGAYPSFVRDPNTGRWMTPDERMAQERGYWRRRRMNVLNPRALRRAIGRVKGFSKFAQRVGSYTQPGKRYRLKGFGRRGRRH